MPFKPLEDLLFTHLGSTADLGEEDRELFLGALAPRLFFHKALDAEVELWSFVLWHSLVHFTAISSLYSVRSCEFTQLTPIRREQASGPPGPDPPLPTNPYTQGRDRNNVLSESGVIN
jgi:hypothetical protein